MDTNEAIDDVLMHYGKKGMKWGVITRAKEKRSSAKTQKEFDKESPVVVTKGRGGKPKALGGHGRGIHEDAARAAALRKVGKESGAHSLSNKEMQDVITRMELAGRYQQVNKKNRSAGSKFATELMDSIGKDLTKELGKSISKGISNMAKAQGQQFSAAMLEKALKDAPMSMMWGE